MDASGDSTPTGQSGGAPRATAVIGDVAAFRELGSERRGAVQRRLGELLDDVNRGFREDVLAGLTLTLGDEFQGLLVRPSILPRLLWTMRTGLADVRIWTGVGHGTLDTELREEAIGMGGPAFHRAREALEEGKSAGRHGGVFRGFGEDDAVLGGLARLLEARRQRLTEAQVEAIDLIREGRNQRQAAEALGVTPQAVSKRLRAAGWSSLEEGEEALEQLLGRYDTAADWGEEP